LSKNLALRLAVAAVGIPALLTMAYYGGYFLVGFCALLAGLGAHEFSAMAQKKVGAINHFWIIILPVTCVAAAFTDFPLIYVFVGAFIICAILALKRNDIGIVFDLFNVYFISVIYLGLLSAIILFLGLYPVIGNRLLLMAFLIVWAVDTAAYFGGKAFGKKKLAPAISPNKTWAGFYFGFLGALIAAIVSKLIFLNIDWPKLFAMAVLACLFGQIGDLFESALKRYFGVKDSSAILPGHGGILDRFDSLLFAAPVVYLIAIFWR
jgi:phosphatidate cytidylyltransferase